MLKLIGQVYSSIATFIAFIVLILPISLIALFIPKHELRLKMTAPFWILFFKFIIKAVTFTKLYSEDKRPKEDQKFCPTGLYICNHQSFMDIPVTLSHFAIPPIMKKEVLYIPVFGIAAYSSGALIVDRSSHKSRIRTYEKATARLLEKDGRLQYYPEGTRTRGGVGPKEVTHIKSKIIKFAYTNNIPVYPMSVSGTDKILNSRGLISFRKKAGIILHPPRKPSEFETCDDFINTCWKDVKDGYTELAEKLI